MLNVNCINLSVFLIESEFFQSITFYRNRKDCVVTVCDHPLICVTFSVSPKNCFESVMFL